MRSYPPPQGGFDRAVSAKSFAPMHNAIGAA
jgi:hypothetical protein